MLAIKPQQCTCHEPMSCSDLRQFDDSAAQQASPPPPLPPPLPNSHSNGKSKLNFYEAMPMVDPMSMQPRPPPPPPPPTTDSPSDGKSGPNFYEAMSMVDFPNGIISHGGSGKYKPKPKPAPMPTIPKRRTLLGLNFPEPTGTCLPTPDDSPEDVISHGGSGKYKPKPKPAPLPTIPERRTCLGHNFCDLTGTCPPKPEPGPLPLPFGPPPTDPPLPLDLERYSSDDGMNMDEHIPDGPMPPRRPWIEPIPPSARPKPQPNPRPDYYYADDKRDGLCFEGPDPTRPRAKALSATEGGFKPPRRPQPDPTRPRAKRTDDLAFPYITAAAPGPFTPPGPPYPNPAPRPGNPHPSPPNKPRPHGPNPIVSSYYTDMTRFPPPRKYNGWELVGGKEWAVDEEGVRRG